MIRGGRGGLTKAADVYEGTSLLTGQASRLLLGKLMDYLKVQQADDKSGVKELMEKVRKVLVEPGFACLSQSLSGFNEALLMHKQTRQMEIDDPLGFQAERRSRRGPPAVQDEYTGAPEPSWDFNPIRSGGLEVLASGWSTVRPAQGPGSPPGRHHVAPGSSPARPTSSRPPPR